MTEKRLLSRKDFSEAKLQLWRKRTAQHHEEKAEKQERIPNDVWEVILGRAAIGTGKFPQSFISSGIKIAQAMVEFSQNRNIPLTIFLEEDPSDELIQKEMSPAKVRAHKAYGFETGGEDYDLRNVWQSDKRSGITILENVARLVDQLRNRSGGDKSKISSEHLNALASDPLFQGLLTKLSDTLSERDVVDISNGYKRLIHDFMVKFAPSPPKGDYQTPKEYFTERKELMENLTSMLRSGMVKISEHIVDYLKSPEVKGMENMHWWKGDTLKLRRLTFHLRQRPESLVGDIEVSTVDPLRLKGFDF